MKSVTLQFPSIFELIECSLTVDSTMFEADGQENTLTCELSDADIRLAEENDKAVPVFVHAN